MIETLTPDRAARLFNLFERAKAAGDAELRRVRNSPAEMRILADAPALAPDRAARLLLLAARNAGTLRSLAFNPDEPRDDQGQWTDGGASDAQEDETLRLYTRSGGTYREVNEGLRGGKNMSSDPTVVVLDKAFAAHSEAAPAVVYRGLAGYEPEELNLVEGATFTDLGFVSTTAAKSDAVKFATNGEGKLSGEGIGIVFKINTGKSSSLDMSRYSRYDESEHLLNRGTTFKVTSVKEGSPGSKLAVVTMSVVK
jgi:hypothetical protein